MPGPCLGRARGEGRQAQGEIEETRSAARADPALASLSPHGSYSSPASAPAAVEARLDHEKIETDEDSGAVAALHADVPVASEAAPDTTSPAAPGAVGPGAQGRCTADVSGDVGDDFECRPCEDIEPLKHGSSPIMPSAAEVEEHRTAGHVQYRSWCSECVRGRGLGEQRGRHAGRPHSIPVIGIDYWYITETGIRRLADFYGFR